MIPYLSIYIVSSMFMGISMSINNENTAKIAVKKIFSLISILSLVFFVVLSDNSVGIDRIIYVEPIFKNTVSLSNLNFLIQAYPDVEKGYLLFNWIISKISTSIYFYYFVYSFIVNLCFYYALKLFNREINFLIAWFFYLTIFFPVTLCLFRQSLAVAFVTLGIAVFYKKKKILIPLILISLAISIHSSAMIGIVFMIVIYFLELTKYKLSIQVAMLFILMLFSGSIKLLLPYLIKVGILSAKYTNYANGFLGTEQESIIGLSIVFIFIGLLYIKEIKNNSTFNFIYFFSILSFFVIPLNDISAVIGRLGFYFKFFLILYYSFLVKNVFLEKKIYLKKFLVAALLVIYIVTSSNNFILGLKSQEDPGTFRLYPYSSTVLKELFESR